MTSECNYENLSLFEILCDAILEANRYPMKEDLREHFSTIEKNQCCIYDGHKQYNPQMISQFCYEKYGIGVQCRHFENDNGWPEVLVTTNDNVAKFNNKKTYKNTLVQLLENYFNEFELNVSFKESSEGIFVFIENYVDYEIDKEDLHDFLNIKTSNNFYLRCNYKLNVKKVFDRGDILLIEKV